MCNLLIFGGGCVLGSIITLLTMGAGKLNKEHEIYLEGYTNGLCSEKRCQKEDDEE